MSIIELDCSNVKTNSDLKSSLCIVKDRRTESWVGTGFFYIEKDFIKIRFLGCRLRMCSPVGG